MKKNKNSLRDFLVQATLDINFQKLIIASPDEAIKGFKLSEEQIKSIKSGNFDELILHDPEVAAVFVRAINMNTLSNDMVAVMPFDLDMTVNTELSEATTQIIKASSEDKGKYIQKLIKEINRQNRKTEIPIPEALPDPKVSYDIYIVGLGMINGTQVTKEVEHVLAKAGIIYYVGSGLGLYEYLTSFNVKAIDLGEASYVENENRMEAYERMASTIIEAAYKHKHVVLALYGHPTVFAYPPFLIKQMCDALKLNVKVMPGISALDCLLTDLMVDPGQSGMLMYEATDLLARYRTMLPDVATIIWQLGSVESALYSNRKSKPQRFWRFRQHVLQFYPPDHIVKAIFCRIHPLSNPVIYKFPIGRISDYAEVLHAGFTLYIPPVKSNKGIDLNYELLMQVESEQHLNIITEKPKENKDEL